MINLLLYTQKLLPLRLINFKNLLYPFVFSLIFTGAILSVHMQAFAAEEDDPLPPQEKIEGMKDAVLKAEIKKEGMVPNIKVVVHYPEGTGNTKVDTTLSELAKSTFETVKSAEFEAPMGGQKRTNLFATTYRIAKPSSGWISFVFSNWEYTGGAHNMWEESVTTFDMSTGEQVKIKDLIPNSDSYPKIVEYLNTHKAENLLLEGSVIKGEKGSAVAIETTIDDITMDRIVLAPEGLKFIFSPYEKASFSEGSLVLTIPKSSFTSLGISSSFWKK